MSFIFRNFTFLRRYVTVNKFQCSLLYSSSQESIINSANKELGNDQSTIFDYIQKNHELFTCQNCLEILEQLSKNDLTSNFQLIKKTEKKYFLIVCNELNKQINNLNLSQTIEAMELLCKIQLPTNSLIFQSLLVKIHNEVCHFTDRGDINVLKLQKVLSEMKKSELANNIRRDLLIALNSNDNQEITDIYEMCSNLYKVTNKMVNEEMIIVILNGISKYPKEIPVLTAKSIFISLCKVSRIAILQYNDLLRKIENILIKNASKLNYDEILLILDKIYFNSKGKPLKYSMYNEHLIDALITSLLSNDNLHLEKGIEILATLEDIGHVQINLLEYLMMKCFEQPWIVSKLTKNQLSKFLRGLTVCTDKPPFWDSIKYLIINQENGAFSNVHLVTRIAYYLALLNFFPHNLISFAFSQTQRDYEESHFSTKRNFLRLYQLVKTMDPSYPGPWPSPSLLKIVLKDHVKYFKDHDNILSTLEKALGGSEYIKSKMQTRYRHQIDHIIVMRKGGFPVAINFDNDGIRDNVATSFVEDVIAPPESQMIAILYFSAECYLKNVNQLRRNRLLQIKSLEALNYAVIPICYTTWMDFNEKDKIPFIMNQIKLKCIADENWSF